MVVNEALVVLQDVAEINREAVELIVLEVSKGTSVRELHECYEDVVPNPIVVNRWRRQYPAFDLLMQEAETAAAESLAFEILKIADDEDRQSAQARNAIDARKWLAGIMDKRFSSGGGAKAGNSITINAGEHISDEKLMEIAAGALAAGSLEGSSERVEEKGASGEVQGDGGAVVHGDGA